MEVIRTSQDRTLRIYSLNSLGKIGTNADKVVPFLIRMLGDKKEEGIRNVVARAIMEMGPDAKTAIPHLLKALDVRDVNPVPDTSLPLRIVDSVLQALGAMGPDGKEAVPALLALFGDPDTPIRVRSRTLSTLGEIGSGAKAAIPQLITWLVDPQFGRHRFGFCQTLAQIGPAAVKPVMERFKTATPYGRVGLLWTLGEIGPPAKEAIPLLEQLAQDKDAMVRGEASKVIHRIDPKHQ